MKPVLLEWQGAAGQWVRLVQGDITEEAVDAIVNAANEHLSHGGGVAGTIVRKGGYEIQQESNAWVDRHGPVPTGSAAITGAGRLPARYVIHAVGPVWGSGREEEKLARAVRSALQMAVAYHLGSISMPAISAGIFGFPAEQCARVILETTRDFLSGCPEDCPLQEIRVCLYGAEMAWIFESVGRRLLQAE